jgi:hypothetical protein
MPEEAAVLRFLKRRLTRKTTRKKAA